MVAADECEGFDDENSTGGNVRVKIAMIQKGKLETGDVIIILEKHEGRELIEALEVAVKSMPRKKKLAALVAQMEDELCVW